MDADRRIITATQSTLITLSSELMEERKRIFLKVQRGLKQGDEFSYWMGRNVPFRELMIDYTRRIGVSLNSVRFVFDGNAINPSFSAESLKLEDGDTIDVVQRDKYYMGTERTLICLARPKGEMPITLKVSAVGGNCPFHYLIGRNTPLENLFLDYADRSFRFYDNTKFVITQNGLRRRCDPKKTADDLKLEDGDAIIAKTKTDSIQQN